MFQKFSRAFDLSIENKMNGDFVRTITDRVDQYTTSEEGVFV